MYTKLWDDLFCVDQAVLSMRLVLSQSSVTLLEKTDFWFQLFEEPPH